MGPFWSLVWNLCPLPQNIRLSRSRAPFLSFRQTFALPCVSRGSPQVLRSLLQHRFDAFVFISFGLHSDFQIVSTLEIQPELSGSAQCLAETNGAVHSDAAAFFDEIVDPAYRQSCGCGKLTLPDATGFEDFLPQDTSWVNAWQAFSRDSSFACVGDGFHKAVKVWIEIQW